MNGKDTFPPLMLLRRYLKLAIEFAAEHDLLDCPLSDPPPVPFSLSDVPTKYPPPSDLSLWVQPTVTGR